MQSLKKCILSLTSSYKSIINNATISKPLMLTSNIHTSLNLRIYDEIEDKDVSKQWLSYNKMVFPPQEPGEKPRPAFVNHMKANVQYNPKKMWYVACFVRGMSVDEAVKQLSFCSKKGAAIVKEAILEAQEMAVKDHNVEFKSNLWVSESFSSKGNVIKGIRRHGKKRMGKVCYKYSNYFVKLEEGKPPKNYYLPLPQSKEDLIEDWLIKMRRRRVGNSL